MRLRYRWFRVRRLAFYYGNRSGVGYGWQWFTRSRLGPAYYAKAGPFFIVLHTRKRR